MRLHSFVLLAATFLLAYVGNTSKGEAADAPAQVRWDTEEQTNEGNEARVVTTSFNFRQARFVKRFINRLRAKPTIMDSETAYLKQQSLDQQQPLIRTSKRAENNDISVQMFLAASQWKTKAISKPATEKLFRVLLSRDYSVDDMFSALIKNDKTAHKIFFDKKWQLLKGYVEASTKHKDPAVLVETVVKGFGDEGKLLTALANAREDPRAKENALYLEDLLLAKWAGDEKQPEIVLRMLGLDQKVDLLASPATDIIVKYVGLFNKKNPDRQFSLIKALTDIHDDAEVMEYLSRYMSKHDWASDFSRELRDDLLHKWLQLKKPLEEVFDLLGMEKAEEPLFSKKLKMLQDYHYKAGLTNAKPPMLSTVLRKKYSDDDFAIKTAGMMMMDAKLLDGQLEYLDDILKAWYVGGTQLGGLKQRLHGNYEQHKREVDAIVERYRKLYDEDVARLQKSTTYINEPQL